MATLSDETLMAYADGELDQAGRASVEAVLERDSEARARLVMFERTGRRVVGAHFDAMLHEPVPRELIETVLASGMPSRGRPTSVSASTPGIIGWFATALAPMFQSWPTAAAYAASIAITAGAAWTLKPTTMPAPAPAGVVAGGPVVSPSSLTPVQVVSIKDGHIEAGGVLQRALETMPSRMRTEASSSGSEQSASVMLRLSYRSPSNAYCRQYELRLPTGEGFAGIGCRTGDGTWQVQSHVPIGTVAAADGQKTSPASGAIPPEIASIVERTGQALSDSEEKAALSSSWAPQAH